LVVVEEEAGDDHHQDQYQRERNQNLLF